MLLQNKSHRSTKNMSPILLHDNDLTLPKRMEIYVQRIKKKYSGCETRQIRISVREMIWIFSGLYDKRGCRDHPAIVRVPFESNSAADFVISFCLLKQPK